MPESGLFPTLFAMPGVDADPETPGERLHVFRPDELPQTEWFAATDSARMWRVHHERYTFCVLPPERNARESGALYSYRHGQVHCRPHGAYFYEPDTVHANRVIFRPAAFYVLVVDSAAVTGAANELGLGDRPHFRLAESSSAPVLRAFMALSVSLASHDPLEEQTRLAEMLRVVLAEAGEARALDAAICRVGVAKAREYLHDHVLDRVSLEELSGVAGLGRYQLVRSFRRRYGLAPHAYQSALRCSRARQLLAAGVAPSAIDVGFFDQSHLTRHFVRAYGVTPGAYQRAVAGTAAGRHVMGGARTS